MRYPLIRKLIPSHNAQAYEGKGGEGGEVLRSIFGAKNLLEYVFKTTF